jgi:hypothetical protein
MLLASHDAPRVLKAARLGGPVKQGIEIGHFKIATGDPALSGVLSWPNLLDFWSHPGNLCVKSPEFRGFLPETGHLPDLVKCVAEAALGANGSLLNL